MQSNGPFLDKIRTVPWFTLKVPLLTNHTAYNKNSKNVESFFFMKKQIYVMFVYFSVFYAANCHAICFRMIFQRFKQQWHMQDGILLDAVRKSLCISLFIELNGYCFESNISLKYIIIRVQFHILNVIILLKCSTRVSQLNYYVFQILYYPLLIFMSYLIKIVLRK